MKKILVLVLFAFGFIVAQGQEKGKFSEVTLRQYEISSSIIDSTWSGFDNTLQTYVSKYYFKFTDEQFLKIIDLPNFFYINNSMADLNCELKSKKIVGFHTVVTKIDASDIIESYCHNIPIYYMTPIYKLLEQKTLVEIIKVEVKQIALDRKQSYTESSKIELEPLTELKLRFFFDEKFIKSWAKEQFKDGIYSPSERKK